LGSISVHSAAAPVLLSVQRTAAQEVPQVLIAWKLDYCANALGADGASHEEDGGGPVRPHRLCVECASLPFEDDPCCFVEGRNGNEYDFVDSVEIELSSAAVSGENTTAIEFPQRRSRSVFRVKYSSDGGASWTDHSNTAYLQNASQLELEEMWLTFDPDRSGHSLRFGADDLSVECAVHDDLYHTALFGVAITPFMAPVFAIKFRIRSFAVNKRRCDFFLGFATGSKVNDYDQALGCAANKSCSSGIRICGRSLFLYNHSHSKSPINHLLGSQGALRVHDTFRLVFDFRRNLWFFHHGKKHVLKRKLMAKCIVPGVSLANRGESVEVVSWKFR